MARAHQLEDYRNFGIMAHIDAGKTTTTAKIAKRLTERDKRRVLMASLDVKRPAAQEQLAVLGRQVEVDTLPIVADQTPLRVTLASPRTTSRRSTAGMDSTRARRASSVATLRARRRLLSTSRGKHAPHAERCSPPPRKRMRCLQLISSITPGSTSNAPRVALTASPPGPRSGEG